MALHGTTHTPRSTLAVLFVLLLAFGLRAYGIADWPFSGEEVATLDETRAFLDRSTSPPDSQIARLPRIIPASYVVSSVGYRLFGWNELGTRIIPALAGVALVAAAIGLSVVGFSVRFAVILGLLVAVSPPHVFHSQAARFYSLTALFAGVTMLAGSRAAVQGSVAWALVAAGSSALAVLTHTTTVVLLPLVAVGIILTTWLDGRPTSRLVVIVLGATTLVLAGWIASILPLLQGWNDEVAWGYSAAHAVLASINMLGWPMALLAGLGVWLMFEDGTRLRWYWTACLVGFAGVSALAPLVVEYQPSYAFPFALSALVFAAYAIWELYGRLREVRPVTAVLWVGVALSMNLPTLASHFADGSRSDMRTAVNYVVAHWEPTDRLAVVPVRPVRHYAPHLDSVFLIPRGDQGADTLERLAGGSGRLWVAIDRGRSGLPAAVDRWLAAHATHRLRVSKPRFDYFEYAVDVFLVNPASTRNR